MDKRNFLIGLIIGLLIGILSFPVISNLDLPLDLKSKLSISAALAILTVVGLLAMSFLSRWIAVFWQIGKFTVVGGLNTFVDFAVLNTLIILSGIAAGWGYSIFKGISFIVAVTNSYFWNKYWTFEKPQIAAPQKSTYVEFIQFAIVAVIGFGINVGTASLIVNVFGAQFGISDNLLANLGAAVATIISLVWNFFGYKFIVFKK